MPFTGKGKKGVLVVAEAPGKTEDEQGVQLIGESGQLLRDHLNGMGVELDRDCWKTNAVVCFPHRTPTDKEVECCYPNLMKTVKELKPKVIVLLGGVAVKSLIGRLWRQNTGAISRWVGWRIPCQQLNAWICPTYHPAYLLRENSQTLGLWFGEHLRRAFELKERPWKTVPNYAEQVTRVIRADKMIVNWLDSFIEENKPVAFDYETTHLKPDADDACIWTCSVSDGNRTIAYPWSGVAVENTERLLLSDVPKIGANIKFEQRWTKRVFGHGVKNWRWDTMLAAHALDHREGITSVKFQAFVQLGQPSYDDHIRPYLQADKPGQANRIKQLDLQELLLYNGLDSLCEWKIAQRQMKQMGVNL
jgi:DNA polymerase